MWRDDGLCSWPVNAWSDWVNLFRSVHHTAVRVLWTRRKYSGEICVGGAWHDTTRHRVRRRDGGGFSTESLSGTSTWCFLYRRDTLCVMEFRLSVCLSVSPWVRLYVCYSWQKKWHEVKCGLKSQLNSETVKRLDTVCTIVVSFCKLWIRLLVCSASVGQCVWSVANAVFSTKLVLLQWKFVWPFTVMARNELEDAAWLYCIFIE